MLSDGAAALAAERTVLPDGTVHILVSGSVDAVASCELMDVLIGGLTLGRTLIVDLAPATYIDDTGMAALAVADRIAVLHGGELRVLGVQRRGRTPVEDDQIRPAGQDRPRWLAEMLGQG